MRSGFLACLCLCLTATGLRAGKIHDAAAAGDLDEVRALLAADPTQSERHPTAYAAD